MVAAYLYSLMAAGTGGKGGKGRGREEEGTHEGSGRGQELSYTEASLQVNTIQDTICLDSGTDGNRSTGIGEHLR